MHEFSPFALGGLVAVGWVQEELEQLQQRVDFLERALASRQPPAELPRDRTPV